MPAILFKCPNTGFAVQGWIAEEVADDDDTYWSVPCLACEQSHMVNPSTGRLLGDEK
jgi:hypothetical protein